MLDQERAALAALLLMKRPKGITTPVLTADVLTRGSALEAWDALHADKLLPDPDPTLDQAWQALLGWTKDGTKFLGILDDSYPRRLRGIHEAPPAIFAVGDVRTVDVGVSLVGSRDATPRALSDTTQLATVLAQRGVTVVSGLAQGIDAAAHHAALAVGGRTVAFLGTGVRQVYPAAHKELQARVAATGALFSQFLPDARAGRHTFPMRNVLMSGYGYATVVMQASEDSGTRHQVKAAIGHGRAVILTPEVATSTSWGRAYAESGAAKVAHTLEQTVTMIDELVRDATRPGLWDQLQAI